MEQPKVKQLTRSRTNRVIAGVCGGLGEYFELDPTIIRVIFVLLAVFGGSGLLIYLILAIVLPNEDQSPGVTKESIKKNAEALGAEIKEKAESVRDSLKGTPHHQNGRSLFAIVVIIVGALILLNNFHIFQFSIIGRLWPVILIVIGLAVLLRRD